MASVEDACSSKLTPEERVELAKALKERGNDYFKKQEYRKAMKNYHKALLHVKGLIDQPKFPGIVLSDEVSDELKNCIHQIQFSCYNNLAACLSKDERWDRSEHYCSEALKLRPDNAKALFRRGQSYLYMKDFDKAERDLKAAEKLEPKDSSIKKMLTLLEVELKRVKEKEKKIYAGMFDRNSEKE